MKINSDSLHPLHYFVGVTDQNSQLTNIPSDFNYYEKEERINYSVLEYFLLHIIRKKVIDKNEFLIITYEALKDTKLMVNVHSNLMNVNIEQKKYIFIPYQFKETGNWCLLFFENFYSNFSQDLLKKILSLKTNNIEKLSKLNFIYFNDEIIPNIKETKNAVVNKLEAFFSNYLVNKFKVRFENCFNSEKLSFDLKYLKLRRNKSIYENGLIIMKLIQEIITHNISDIWNEYNSLKLNYSPSVIKEELKFITSNSKSNLELNNKNQDNSKSNLHDDLAKISSTQVKDELSISEITVNSVLITEESDKEFVHSSPVKSYRIMENKETRIPFKMLSMTLPKDDKVETVEFKNPYQKVKKSFRDKKNSLYLENTNMKVMNHTAYAWSKSHSIGEPGRKTADLNLLHKAYNKILDKQKKELRLSVGDKQNHNENFQDNESYNKILIKQKKDLRSSVERKQNQTENTKEPDSLLSQRRKSVVDLNQNNDNSENSLVVLRRKSQLKAMILPENSAPCSSHPDVSGFLHSNKNLDQSDSINEVNIKMTLKKGTNLPPYDLNFLIKSDYINEENILMTRKKGTERTPYHLNFLNKSDSINEENIIMTHKKGTEPPQYDLNNLNKSDSIDQENIIMTRNKGTDRPPYDLNYLNISDSINEENITMTREKGSERPPYDLNYLNKSDSFNEENIKMTRGKGSGRLSYDPNYVDKSDTIKEENVELTYEKGSERPLYNLNYVDKSDTYNEENIKMTRVKVSERPLSVRDNEENIKMTHEKGSERPLSDRDNEENIKMTRGKGSGRLSYYPNYVDKSDTNNEENIKMTHEKLSERPLYYLNYVDKSDTIREENIVLTHEKGSERPPYDPNYLDKSDTIREENIVLTHEKGSERPPYDPNYLDKSDTIREENIVLTDEIASERPPYYPKNTNPLKDILTFKRVSINLKNENIRSVVTDPYSYDENNMNISAVRGGTGKKPKKRIDRLKTNENIDKLFSEKEVLVNEKTNFKNEDLSINNIPGLKVKDGGCCADSCSKCLLF